jgi:ATP/maltotriose-dependent transcriptional regulator MalT
MLLLGRARQCERDSDAAAASLRVAADMFKAAGQTMEEVMARSMLAACSTADGDRAGAAAQVREVREILERSGVAEAGSKAAAARDACQPSSAGTMRLMAG